MRRPLTCGAMGGNCLIIVLGGAGVLQRIECPLGGIRSKRGKTGSGR